MIENVPTRRDVLTKAVPALALAGIMANASGVLAQADGQAGGAPEVDVPRGGSPIANAIGAGYKDGKYTLPPLPYPYEALEPHIDRQTMQLHHDAHHQGYVDGLNKALASVAELQAGGDVDTAKLEGLQRNVSFNAGGHILHTVFWATMAPNTGGDPAAGSAIADAINKQFGSIQAFKSYYSSVAGGVKGSGWAILAYEPVGDTLVVTQSGDQDLRMVPGAAPLLPLDVWEHAYYLKYQNKRADYIKAWWNVVNWPAVDAAYVATRKMYGR
ncbi:MAG TPA: superoxide dismutase [Tepidisphaeraceae bacterium]|jgi:Fe-Mn family superoxide dismutase|nr:superoxide dismutase [Tepidisphaeraceae bacterium]